MGVLLIKCPTTGREFSTGIQVDEETLAGCHRNSPTPIARIAKHSTPGRPRGQDR